MIGGRCFAVEGVDTAARAEIMPRNFGVPAIFADTVLRRAQRKIILMHFHHQRIFLHAKRAIASRQFREVAGDFKPNLPAMTGAVVLVHASSLKLKPALHKDAGRFLVERGWDAEGDAVYFAVDILNASAECEFIKVIGDAKCALV